MPHIKNKNELQKALENKQPQVILYGNGSKSTYMYFAPDNNREGVDQPFYIGEHIKHNPNAVFVFGDNWPQNHQYRQHLQQQFNEKWLEQYLDVKTEKQFPQYGSGQAAAMLPRIDNTPHYHSHVIGLPICDATSETLIKLIDNIFLELKYQLQQGKHVVIPATKAGFTSIGTELAQNRMGDNPEKVLQHLADRIKELEAFTQKLNENKLEETERVTLEDIQSSWKKLVSKFTPQQVEQPVKQSTKLNNTQSSTHQPAQHELLQKLGVHMLQALPPHLLEELLSKIYPQAVPYLSKPLADICQDIFKKEPAQFEQEAEEKYEAITVGATIDAKIHSKKNEITQKQRGKSRGKYETGRLDARESGTQDRHVTPIALVEQIIGFYLEPGLHLQQALKIILHKAEAFIPFDDRERFVQHIFDYFKDKDRVQNVTELNELITKLFELYNQHSDLTIPTKTNRYTIKEQTGEDEGNKIKEVIKLLAKCEWQLQQFGAEKQGKSADSAAMLINNEVSKKDRRALKPMEYLSKERITEVINGIRGIFDYNALRNNSQTSISAPSQKLADYAAHQLLMVFNLCPVLRERHQADIVDGFLTQLAKDHNVNYDDLHNMVSKILFKHDIGYYDYLNIIQTFDEEEIEPGEYMKDYGQLIQGYSLPYNDEDVEFMPEQAHESSESQSTTTSKDESILNKIKLRNPGREVGNTLIENTKTIAFKNLEEYFNNHSSINLEPKNIKINDMEDEEVHSSTEDINPSNNGINKHQNDRANLNIANVPEDRQSSYLLQAHDINYIAEELLSKLPNTQRDQIYYLPVQSASRDVSYHTTAQQQLESREVQEALAAGKRVVAIYNKDGNHWVAYMLYINKEKELRVYYKDSYGNGLDPHLEQSIKNSFSKMYRKKVDFKNKVEQQNDAVNCGIFALKNLVILATTETEYLKDIKFYAPIDNPNNTSESIEIAEIRNEFATLYNQHANRINANVNERNIQTANYEVEIFNKLNSGEKLALIPDFEGQLFRRSNEETLFRPELQSELAGLFFANHSHLLNKCKVYAHTTADNQTGLTFEFEQKYRTQYERFLEEAGIDISQVEIRENKSNNIIYLTASQTDQLIIYIRLQQAIATNFSQPPASSSPAQTSVSQTTTEPPLPKRKFKEEEKYQKNLASADAVLEPTTKKQKPTIELPDNSKTVKLSANKNAFFKKPFKTPFASGKPAPKSTPSPKEQFSSMLTNPNFKEFVMEQLPEFIKTHLQDLITMHGIEKLTDGYFGELFNKETYKNAYTPAWKCLNSGFYETDKAINFFLDLAKPAEVEQLIQSYQKQNDDSIQFKKN